MHRMTAYLSAIAARFGSFSHRASPGTLVWVAPYQPRTLSGASGLGSNVSWWPGPPHWWRKMTALARALGAARAVAVSSCGKVRPSRPVPPTVRRERRERVCAIVRSLRRPVPVLAGTGPHSLPLPPQQEFLRVHQPPGHILPRRPLVSRGPDVGQELFPLGRGRVPADGRQVQLVQHTRRRCAGREQPADPVVRLAEQLVDQRPGNEL